MLYRRNFKLKGIGGGAHRLGASTVIYQRQKQIVRYSFTALGFKAGKGNITTSTPGLFACKVIYFPSPFYGGQQVSVLASVGHTVTTESNASERRCSLG